MHASLTYFCTSLGQLAFTRHFLCSLLSITTNNIDGRMLTFKHVQFINCFNLPAAALHCASCDVVRHQLNFVTLKGKDIIFESLTICTATKSEHKQIK